MFHNIKKAIALTAVALLTLTGTAFSADTITIGLAGPHTGDLAPYGLPTKDAAELLVAEVNAAGGVLGKQINLVTMDDQCKPEVASNVATNLVSEGAVIVIGHVCSGATKAPRGKPPP